MILFDIIAVMIGIPWILSNVSKIIEKTISDRIAVPQITDGKYLPGWKKNPNWDFENTNFAKKFCLPDPDEEDKIMKKINLENTWYAQRGRTIKRTCLLDNAEWYHEAVAFLDCMGKVGLNSGVRPDNRLVYDMYMSHLGYVSRETYNSGYSEGQKDVAMYVVRNLNEAHKESGEGIKLYYHKSPRGYVIEYARGSGELLGQDSKETELVDTTIRR